MYFYLLIFHGLRQSLYIYQSKCITEQIRFIFNSICNIRFVPRLKLFSTFANEFDGTGIIEVYRVVIKNSKVMFKY